jgi:hypothetical protein
MVTGKQHFLTILGVCGCYLFMSIRVFKDTHKRMLRRGSEYKNIKWKNGGGTMLDHPKMRVWV